MHGPVSLPMGPHTKSIGDLRTFLSGTGPQVSIGSKHVSTRACKQNILSLLPLGTSTLAQTKFSVTQTPRSKQDSLTNHLSMLRGHVDSCCKDLAQQEWTFLPVFLSVLERSMEDPAPLQAAIAAMQALCVNDNICKRVCAPLAPCWSQSSTCIQRSTSEGFLSFAQQVTA